jgi:hypothetical protein
MNAADQLADPGFGNYMLNGLREISLPEPIAYQPQTVGWKVLGIILLVTLVLMAFRGYQHWRANAYRRAALKRHQALAAMAQTSDTQVAALRALPALLKQTALAVYPREEIAELSGDRWLTFLDSTYNAEGFTQGKGQLLADLPYQPDASITQLSSPTVSYLFTLTRQWITQHQRPKPRKSPRTRFQKLPTLKTPFPKGIPNARFSK